MSLRALHLNFCFLKVLRQSEAFEKGSICRNNTECPDADGHRIGVRVIFCFHALSRVTSPEGILEIMAPQEGGGATFGAQVDRFLQIL